MKRLELQSGFFIPTATFWIELFRMSDKIAVFPAKYAVISSISKDTSYSEVSVKWPVALGNRPTLAAGKQFLEFIKGCDTSYW